MTAPLLVVSPKLVRTGAETFWDAGDGREIVLGPALTTLVHQFAVPCTVDTAVDALGAASAAGEVNAAVTELVDRRVLVPYRADGVRSMGARSTGAGGLFGYPVLDVADALRGDAADVVVLGMPYDVGVTYRPGSRFAPEYLRRVSGALFQYVEVDGVPVGMYDPVRERRVLDGVRLADIGDVAGPVFSRNGPGLDTIAQLTGRLAAASRFPVLLGGDHSVSLPAIRGMLGHHPEMGVLHIDAHADYIEARTDDWRADCHHGNFMSWVVGDERVRRVAQLGVRQLTAGEPETPDKVLRWAGRSAVLAGAGAVLDGLPAELPYYLTIDLDGLDPSVMPATGTPLPGGFGHAELVELLEGICAERRIVGMDMVELLPDTTDWPGLVAADILLRALDAAVGRGRR